MEGDKCFIGLEIGGSKVAAIAGIHEQGRVKILAFSEKVISDEVIKSGKVVNIETASDSINEVLDGIVAQTNASDIELDLDSVNINICNLEIISQSEKLTVISPEGINRIRPEDVERLLNDAIAAYEPPAGYHTLHCIPKDFYVNNEMVNGVLVGKFGNQLSSDFNFIAVKSNPLNNIIECINQVRAKGEVKGNFKVENVYLNHIADSVTLLDEHNGGRESKRDGVAIINIGATFTEISAYKEGSLRFHTQFPVAGNTINQDLMDAFDISFEDAETLKKICSSIPITYDDSPVVEVKRKHLVEPVEIFLKNAITIIEWRLKEIITLIKAELERSGVGHSLRGGIILTGGTSKFGDIKNLFDQVSAKFNIRKLNFPASIDYNGFEQLKDMRYTTLLGLILTPLNNFDYRINDKRMLTPRPIENKSAVIPDDHQEDPNKGIKVGKAFWNTINDIFRKDSTDLNDKYEEKGFKENLND